MKTPKSIFFALAFMFSLAGNATDNGSKSKVLKQIRQFVHVPDRIGVHQTCVATVFFSVDQNGKVNDVFVKTDDEQVKKDLENQFFRLSLTGLQPGIMNSVDLRFARQ
jgi:hypothetical protein